MDHPICCVPPCQETPNKPHLTLLERFGLLCVDLNIVYVTNVSSKGGIKWRRNGRKEKRKSWMSQRGEKIVTTLVWPLVGLSENCMLMWRHGGTFHCVCKWVRTRGEAKVWQPAFLAAFCCRLKRIKIRISVYKCRVCIRVRCIEKCVVGGAENIWCRPCLTGTGSEQRGAFSERMRSNECPSVKTTITATPPSVK